MLYHPKLGIVFAFVFMEFLFIPIGMVFGAHNSLSWWCLVSEDEDRDDGWMDRPEPHFLLLMPKTVAEESSVKQHWFCATFSFP
jgi:hypothetical protein